MHRQIGTRISPRFAVIFRSSVDYGWLAFLPGPRFRLVWMKNRSRLVVRYRLEAYATLRRCRKSRRVGGSACRRISIPRAPVRRAK